MDFMHDRLADGRAFQLFNVTSGIVTSGNGLSILVLAVGLSSLVFGCVFETLTTCVGRRFCPN